VQRIVRDVALPVCEAVRAHRTGDDRAVLGLMRPALDGMKQLGGSHAQQDVLMRLFLDSAVKADCAGDVGLILRYARDAGFDVGARGGYAEAVRHFAT
jgi:hypothetical protein